MPKSETDKTLEVFLEALKEHIAGNYVPGPAEAKKMDRGRRELAIAFRDECRADLAAEVREVVGAACGLLDKGLPISVGGPTHAALSDLLAKVPIQAERSRQNRLDEIEMCSVSSMRKPPQPCVLPEGHTGAHSFTPPTQQEGLEE